MVTMPLILGTVEKLDWFASTCSRTLVQKSGLWSGPSHIGPETWSAPWHSEHLLPVGGPETLRYA